MDKAEVRTRKIEIDQENMEYINFAYNEEITYWEKAASDRVLSEWEEKIGRFTTPKSFINS